jgi:hypothetical protein
LPAAGDNTTAADVSGWATDYYEIDFSDSLKTLPWLGIYAKSSKETDRLPLTAQIILLTNGGSKVIRTIESISPSQTQGVALDKILEEENLGKRDIKKCYALITNIDPKHSAAYELVAAQ